MSKDNKSNLFYVKIFLVIFAAIFIIAVIIRVYDSYTNRSFTQNTFNVLLISEKYVGIIGLDANAKSLHVVAVTNELESISKRSILLQSINFGIPIHGYIFYPKGVEPEAPTTSFFSLGNIQSIATNSRLTKEKISLFDWARMYMVSGRVEEDMVNIKTYKTINDLITLLPKESESFFRDTKLVERKTTLQVINGTSINGLATRIGDMFSRTGFNVVSVTTEDANDSYIYYSDDSAYEDALSIAKSFGFPVIKSLEYELASITLIIGEETELGIESLVY